jgi:isopentenyldiphosphate isomerase
VSSAAAEPELFDLCDQRGRPTGRTKPRFLVHRDGDWHRAFHCWIVALRDYQPHLILQRRAPTKDTWAGLWDVSVAGHYAAGEGIDGGLREIREEMGLDVNASELVHVGWRREVVFYPDGLIEREIQDVFFLRRDVDLSALCPAPDEVTGVALVPAASLPLMAQSALGPQQLPGVDIPLRGAPRPRWIEIAPHELVPRSGRYYEKVASFAGLLARGQARVLRRRWW